jgi:preprotein translocase subunit YajC
VRTSEDRQTTTLWRFWPSPGRRAQPVDRLLQMAAVMGIFFGWLRPMRSARRRSLLVENLKKGDKVGPAAASIQVAMVEGGIVHLKIADSVRIRIAKSAVAGLEAGEEGESK